MILLLQDGCIAGCELISLRFEFIRLRFATPRQTGAKRNWTRSGNKNPDLIFFLEGFEINMKKWIVTCLLFIAVAAYAENLNETVCIQFHQALDSLNHTKNEIVPTSFEFENKTYEGYEIVFETKWSLLDKEIDPMDMFYPYEGNFWYNAGWRADIRFCADGPGSTFYLIRNSDVFCTIRWYFVSYIDEKTGKYVAGDDLSCKIQFGIEIIQKEK